MSRFLSYATLLALLFWGTSDIAAQEKQEDLIRIYLEKSQAYDRNIKSDSSNLYLKKSEDEAIKIPDVRKRFSILNRIAVIYHNKQQFSDALSISERQYQLSLKIGDKKLMASALNNTGIQQHALGHFQRAISSFIVGLRCADEANDLVSARKLFNNLSSVFIDLKDAKNSLLYAKKSYEAAKSLGDSLQIAKSISNLAISEELSGDIESAIKHLRLQASISQSRGYTDILSDSYNNLAEIFVKQGKYKQALAIYKSALNLYSREQVSDETTFLYLGLANCQYHLQANGLAEVYFDQTIPLAQQSLGKADLKEAYLLGSEIKESLGKSAQALSYRKMYQQINDSLTSSETQRYIRNLEFKYQSSLKEKKLTDLALQISKKDRYIFASLFLISLLLAAGIIAYLVNKSSRQATKLVLLQAQIHPHFLFNTLNNLYSLTLYKSEKAPSVVLGLAQILRYILYECNKGKMKLSRELEIIEKYIFLERIRHQDNLEINLNFCAAQSDEHIEPLFLLPLVENAFKHGIGCMNEGEGWISIEAEVRSGKFIFKIANNKPLEDPVESGNIKYGNIGLDNIRQRLHILYPSKHEFKIVSEPEDFVAILKIDL